ncbi:1625_t:CDS:2, partial [Entrophospora sp. SA101]
MFPEVDVINSKYITPKQMNPIATNLSQLADIYYCNTATSPTLQPTPMISFRSHLDLITNSQNEDELIEYLGSINIVMRVVIENAVKTSNLKPESQNLVKHVEDVSGYVQKLKKKAPKSYEKFQTIKNNIISNDKLIQNNNPLLNFILCKMYLSRIKQNEKALTRVLTALPLELLVYKT